MFYVYLLESESAPGKRYVGFSEDLRNRLEHHNSGKSRFTSRHRPWKLVTYLAFSDQLRRRRCLVIKLLNAVEHEAR